MPVVRTPLSAGVAAFIEKLKFARVVVIADFDDLIFRPELLHLIDGVKYLPDVERQQFIGRTFQYKKMVEAADFILATTLPLAAELTRYNNNVRVIRNYPLDIAREIAMRVKVKELSSEKFIMDITRGHFPINRLWQCADALLA
jgi:hypothetical protein